MNTTGGPNKPRLAEMQTSGYTYLYPNLPKTVAFNPSISKTYCICNSAYMAADVL
jgi:hypothetical protein